MAADIPASLKDWSSTESSNAPTSSTAIGNNLDDNLRRLQSVVRNEVGASDTIASASTCDLGSKDSGTLTITGTTTITSFGTIAAGIRRRVVFEGVLTLTYNATSLIVPGAASITTAAGDCAEFVSLGSGNWRCLQYTRNSGQALSQPSPGVDVTTKTGAYTIVSGDRGDLISCSGSWTLSVTDAATLGSGWWCYYENSGSGSITLSVPTNVDGLSGGFVIYPGEQRMLVSNGTDFETILIRGGVYAKTTAGAVSFKAPPGVPAGGYHIRAVEAGTKGTGNGIASGDGGKGGAGVEFRTSFTAGNTYTGGVGDGAGASDADRKTYLTGVFEISSGHAALSTGSNPYVAGVILGGTGGTGGGVGGVSVFGGGGGGGGPSGTGGSSLLAGAGGNAATAGTAPGGGGGGGNTLGTLGQNGGDGCLYISW